MTTTRRVIHFDRHEDLQREAIDQLFAAACLREVEIRRLRGYVVPRLEADLRAAIDDRDHCREEAEALSELLQELFHPVEMFQ